MDYLIRRSAASFIFSTAPPPSIAAALDASLDIVEREPQRRSAVLERAYALRMQLRAAGVPLSDGTSPIVPVLLGDNDRAVAVAEALQAEGFDVRAIRPPTVPPGSARLRISVNVNLTDELMNRFATTLYRARRSRSRAPVVNADLPSAGNAAHALKTKKPKVVFIAGRVASGLKILQEAKRQGFNAVFVGGDGWQGIVSDTATSEGAYIGMSFTPEDPSPAARAFVAAFEKKFGTRPRRAGIRRNQAGRAGPGRKGRESQSDPQLLTFTRERRVQGAQTGPRSFGNCERSGEGMRFLSF